MLGIPPAGFEGVTTWLLKPAPKIRYLPLRNCERNSKRNHLLI